MIINISHGNIPIYTYVIRYIIMCFSSSYQIICIIIYAFLNNTPLYIHYHELTKMARLLEPLFSVKRGRKQ